VIARVRQGGRLSTLARTERRSTANDESVLETEKRQMTLVMTPPRTESCTRPDHWYRQARSSGADP
jgi:hypothetical protein